MNFVMVLGVCLVAFASASARNFRIPTSFPPVINCRVKYSDWTECDANCGQGQQQRWGFVIVEPKNGGSPCPELEQSRACDSGVPCTPPPQDCEIRFGEWSECSQHCGSGTQTRRGVIIQEAKYGGSSCPRYPALEQQRSCNQFECTETNMDCQVWYGEWSGCSVSCGGGMQWRRAVVEVPQMGFGKPCPELEQEQSCNEQRCYAKDQDCQVWFGEWSNCNKPCGGGFQTRRGVVEQERVGNGLACPQLEQRRTCNEQIECTDNVVDCLVDFSRWTDCSKPCGGGVRRRWGNVVTAPTNGGRPCGQLEQEEPCNEELCEVAVVDCLMRYSEWSTCSVSCGGGTQQRWGEIVVQPFNGGKPCPPQEESRSCNLQQCFERVDCETRFAQWSQCSASCGGGSQWRRGVVVVEPMNGGLECPRLEQERRCNLLECDVPNVDCQMWFGEWSTCDQPCGGGQQFRRGVIEVEAQGSGKQCPNSMQYRSCNAFECSEPQPTDCRVWYSEWTDCSRPCGGGKRSRWGRIEQEALMGGAPCPALEQEETCNEQLCGQNIQDCLVDFTEWTPCSSVCAGGKQLRWGTVRAQPTAGGQPCPALEQERDCNTNINCVPGVQDCLVDFSAWSTCSKPCNGGKRERWGRITQKASPGGKPCPDLEQHEDCNTHSCKLVQPYQPNLIPQVRYMCESQRSGCRACDFGLGRCPSDIAIYSSEAECRVQCFKPNFYNFFPSRQFDSKIRSKRSARRKFSLRPISTQFVPRIPKRVVNIRRKPKVQFDCSRKEDGTYKNARAKCSNVFYMCSNGGAEEMKCAKNLFYNHEIKECDIHAYVPDCSGGRRPATTTLEPRIPSKVTPDPEFDCTKRPNDVFEDPKQKCSPKFYSCSNGQTTREVCQDNLFYDSKTKSCLAWASIYKCSGKVPKKPVSKPFKNLFPSKPVPVNCRKLGNGAFPDPRKECSQTWYNCANGNGYEMTCPALTFFNPVLKDCDAFNNIYACSRRKPSPKIPTPPPPQPKKYPFHCSNRKDGFYKAGKCLKFYWACSGGVTEKMPCGKDMVYDSDLTICDFKFNIPKCGGVRPTLAPQIPIKPKQPVNYDCIKRLDGNYPAGKCKPIYYACSGGEASKMQCPHGLFYDSKANSCGNKKYLLECGGKPLPVEPKRVNDPRVYDPRVFAVPQPRQVNAEPVRIAKPVPFRPSQPRQFIAEPVRPQPQPFRPSRKQLLSLNRSQSNIRNSFQSNRDLSLQGRNRVGSGPSSGGVIGGRVQVTG